MRRLALLLVLALAGAARAANKPNVLLIVGDDWGWTDFGFMGHPEIRTPHLDRLAREGALFPNGYAHLALPGEPGDDPDRTVRPPAPHLLQRPAGRGRARRHVPVHQGQPGPPAAPAR